MPGRTTYNHCIRGVGGEGGTAALSLAGSSFHQMRCQKQKSCDRDDQPLLALSDGGTRRTAEVVEPRPYTTFGWAHMCRNQFLPWMVSQS